jgi:nitrate reductase cytochrome c-type subunit
MKIIKILNISMVAAIVLMPSAHGSAFSNIGSIKNTAHNLTQDSLYVVVGQAVNPMQARRNDYQEVCVYCHTPHGANNTIAAPLWNRTIRVTNYQTYDELGTTTLTQAVSSTPGPASLTCLSCHDGQTAVDSIINMPTTQILTGGFGTGAAKHGNALGTQETTQNGLFLNSWTNKLGPDATRHMGLNSTQLNTTYVLGNGTGTDNIGCLSCHSPVSLTSGGNTDFMMAHLGTDLRNDHPIGVTFPAAAIAGTNNEDFKQPAGLTTQGGSNYFDENLDGKMQKNEIRTYDGKVECASCHDPHGVPSGVGLQFNPTFLRKKQAADVPTGPSAIGSRVCFTCHNK